ncbi:hypothetical protein GUJ93_ZPchr0001g32898 [Zizania palustris]|uniref:Uncharacterized protein n=1 Tax=Zizania palustris TaxID=103762 RepID=A0A8J5V0M8_ZIZPA|nr:hypothetical protein GUJ93_ZPchr0001g32898 [Zizania palustris]
MAAAKLDGRRGGRPEVAAIDFDLGSTEEELGPTANLSSAEDLGVADLSAWWQLSACAVDLGRLARWQIWRAVRSRAVDLGAATGSRTTNLGIVAGSAAAQ